MQKRMLLLPIALLAVSLPIYSQDSFSESDTLSVLPGQGMSLTLSNIVGNIDVIESGSEEITLIYTVTCTDRETFEPVEVAFSRDGGVNSTVSSMDIRTRNGNATVDYQLLVPSQTELDIKLQTTEGNVTMNNGSGSALVEILKGNANIRNVTGNLSVNVVRGDIELYYCSGLKLVNVIDGNLSGILETLSNNVEISAITGNIDLTIPDDMQVEVSTVEGTIAVPGVDVRRNFIGSSARFGEGSGTIVISSYSGNITLAL